jgi:hypothetical protein
VNLLSRHSGARQGGVGSVSGFQAACEIAHANRVDLAVVTLDAEDQILRQLNRGDLLCRNGCR